jgi:hypothetical protein
LATISCLGSRVYHLYFLSCEGERPWRDRSFRFSTSLHFEVCAAFWPSPVYFACVAGFACLFLWAFVLTPLLFLQPPFFRATFGDGRGCP